MNSQETVLTMRHCREKGSDVFDKYVVVDGSLRTDEAADGQVSFSVDLRVPYYRGIGLSMVSVGLVLDGTEIPPDLMAFTVHGNTYPVSALPDVINDRWPLTEAAKVTVTGYGQLSAGEHEVTARVHLRVSYAPNGFGAQDTKMLTLKSLK